MVVFKLSGTSVKIPIAYIKHNGVRTSSVSPWKK